MEEIFNAHPALFKSFTEQAGLKYNVSLETVGGQGLDHHLTEKRALIEGPHLLAAALQHGVRPLAVLATEKGLADAEIGRLVGESGLRPVLFGEAVFRFIVDTEAPQGLAAEVAIPAARAEAPQTLQLSR